MTKRIYLTQGQIALIDDEDFDRVNCFKWTADKVGLGFRAMRACYPGNNKRITIFMHRFIMDAPQGTIIDHINRNALDNRKSNLRFCTKAENQRNRTSRQINNTSGYKGVTKVRNKWAARISHQSKRIHLGYFVNIHQAAEAYNQAALKYFGDFANLNKIGENNATRTRTRRTRTRGSRTRQ